MSSVPFNRNAALGQWMTPAWAAQELVLRYFGDLSPSDQVIEPSCGTGAFLGALPKNVPALGVEIDPALAQIAIAATGRPVIVGDFRTTDLPCRPTVILGNPPFSQAVVQGFLERAYDLLPADGRVGFVLPCYIFQTASTVARLSRKWGIRQDMIPRNVFQNLRLSLCFAQLTRGAGRGLVGFTLYHETSAVHSLQQRYRAILEGGERSIWAAVVLAALDKLGGSAKVNDIYAEIQGHQPTGNPFWKAKVRQTLQRRAVSSGHACWSLPPQVALAA